MSGLTKSDVNSTYSDQLNAIRDKYSNEHKREVYIKQKLLEEQQRKPKYLEFVKRQINGYLTGTCQILPEQIIIVINAMIDVLKPLDDTDRQSLVGDIHGFSLRFERCLPFIDFSNADSRDLVNELNLLNALLLSMNIPIQLTVNMNTSYDDELARSLAYTYS